MPGIKDIANLWNNVREVDLRPIREAALAPIHIAIIGPAGVGRHTLAAQMRTDPHRPENQSQTPLYIATPAENPDLAGIDLVIFMLDASTQEYSHEQNLVGGWLDKGKKVILFVNKIDLAAPGQALERWSEWRVPKVIYGSADNTAFLLKFFVPAVLDLLPDQQLSLGRQFPLFRIPLARALINDTCISNAAYALSTGIAEVVPVLDLPLNIADMIVLTKAQAFLVYKLGLVFGFSTRWQDYVAEFGSVIGGGFLWRQLARMLVGFIPVWGIVPKVAVSYAGTYVVGNVVYQWYLTGRHLDSRQIRQLYVEAFARGKNFASKLRESRQKKPRLRGRKPKALPAPPAGRMCPECHKESAADATFCQYCGYKFTPETA